MARRSRENSKRAKGRPRKAETLKRRAAPTLRRRSSRTVGQESDLRRERDEALERETAISEVAADNLQFTSRTSIGVGSHC